MSFKKLNKNDEIPATQPPSEELTEAQYLPADHPLLAKMQATLTKQLEEELDRLTIDLVQKTKFLGSLEQQKEQVGIRLYESQQKIVELQKESEAKTAQHSTIREDAQRQRENLAAMEEVLQTKVKEAEDLERQLFARMNELSAQNVALREIEAYNAELQSDIKVKRRITYKVEENIVANEHIKNRQDVLINSLYEEEKRIKEQLKILEERKKAQGDQIVAAKGLLAEGQEEIDKVINSKKMLLNHLHRTTMELEEKHNVLEAMNDALQKVREEQLKRSSDLAVLDAKIRFENEQNALLTGMLDKQRKEEKHIEMTQTKVEEKIRKIREKSDLLTKAGTHSEEELKTLDRKAAEVASKMQHMEENIMRFHSEIKAKNEGLVKLISEHKSMEKLQKNTLKRMSELEVARRSKEIEVEHLENEIARVRLDILNTENDIGALQDKRASLQKEQEEGERTISKYESLIKSNHDAHEKKMHEIAKFNREHDKAQKVGDLHSKGPSESTLAQLNTEIAELRKDRKRLEGQFIKSQTLAVEREMACHALSEKISNLKCKETILKQKNMRQNTAYNIHQKEIKELQANLKRYEKDMNKLNDFLALFGDKESSLKNANLNINSEFVEKLKALESASARIEIQIDRLKEGKAELLQEITECERQIVFWERRILMEKEMQETLDPDVGQQEIKALKKELHLKELRLAEIKKQQDGLIIEIDRVVQKRDIIQIKYNQKESQQFCEETDVLKIRKTGVANNTQVAKSIELLKTSIAQSQKGIGNFERQTAKLEKENSGLANTTEGTQRSIESMEDEIKSLGAFVQGFKLRRLVNILKIYVAQQKAMCFEKVLKSGKVVKAANSVVENVKSQGEKSHKLLGALKEIAGALPELTYVKPVLENIEEVVKTEVNI